MKGEIIHERSLPDLITVNEWAFNDSCSMTVLNKLCILFLKWNSLTNKEGPLFNRALQ
jgi:hypothetical protein